jgi:hypothetical protein
MAFEYCCSLGMRVAEFFNYTDLQVARPGKIKYFQFSIKFAVTGLNVSVFFIILTFESFEY